MRKIGFPAYVDTLGLVQDKATREYYLKRATTKMDLEDAAFLLVELQRRLGAWESTDTTSVDYRLRQIEAALGITSPPMPTDIATVTANYLDQWQAGYTLIVGAEESTVVLTNVVSDPATVYARGYAGTLELAVTATLTGTGILFGVPMIPGVGFCQVEWAVKGTLGVQTSPRLIEGTQACVTAGTQVNFATAFANTSDYAVIVTDADAGGGFQTALRVEKNVSWVYFYPAVDATVTYKIVQVTQ